MNNDYTKLSALVDQDFTVEEAYGYQWKMWDNNSKRMLVSEKYEQGYRKMYTIKTDKGKMDISAGQLGNLLEGAYEKGISNIIGRTFHVKSNGKTGVDIRYFINPVRQNDAVRTQSAPKPVVNEPDYDTGINIDDIPF
jgi:hypothetical protein